MLDFEFALPLRGTSEGATYFEHLDTPIIASVFRDAAAGFPLHPVLGSFLPGIVTQARESMSADPSFKLQRFLTQQLEKALIIDSIPSLVLRRFDLLAAGLYYQDIGFDTVTEFFSRLSPAWNTSISKT